MTKTIKIAGNIFMLPEGMPSKDVQALAGFLITLTKVDSYYNCDTYEQFNYAHNGLEVSISDITLMTEAEAKIKSEASKITKAARVEAEARAAAAA